ncbi:MAG TPA: hypothetical protein V6D25_03810 [Leptolyngbyaceae cyanobacterium]
MQKLIKRFCIALLAGTTLSISLNIQEAKADPLEYRYNQCQEAFKYSQRLLDEQEIASCARVYQMRNRRPVQIHLGNGIYDTGTQLITPDQNHEIPVERLRLQERQRTEGREKK